MQIIQAVRFERKPTIQILERKSEYSSGRKDDPKIQFLKIKSRKSKVGRD